MATTPGPPAYRSPAQPDRPFDLGYLITVQRAWARELATEDITRIPTFSLAWYNWIGRPHHHVLSASGHIIEAQKAWAAEQIERQLPVTLAAWEAWLIGPTTESTTQSLESAGFHQLRQELNVCSLELSKSILECYV